MARSQHKHDKIGFYACTSLALGIIVVMWVFSVRSIVGDGVQGTRQVFSEVSSVAGEARRQTTPNPEAVAAVKEGLKSVVTKRVVVDEPADEQTTEVKTIDAVAQLMKNDVETYGKEPKN